MKLSMTTKIPNIPIPPEGLTYTDLEARGFSRKEAIKTLNDLVNFTPLARIGERGGLAVWGLEKEEPLPAPEKSKCWKVCTLCGKRTYRDINSSDKCVRCMTEHARALRRARTGHQEHRRGKPHLPRVCPE